MTAFFQPALRLEPVVKGAAPNKTALFRLPFGLVLLIFLVTGIEAAAGGWLTTFTHRYDATLAISIAVPTCFWAGLLLSRFFWSLYDGSAMEAGTVRGSLMLMTIASILLISLDNSLVTLVAAFLLGFGIGPTYPLLLGWALRRKQGAGIFFLAGVGSACLPWLTGLISAQHSSLRVGLVVPTAGTLLMLIVAMLSPLHLWSQPTGSKDPFSSPGLQPRR